MLGVKQDQVGRNGLCVYVRMRNEEACSVLGASSALDEYEWVCGVP